MGSFKKVFRTLARSFRVSVTFVLQNCSNLQTTLGPSVLSLTKEMHVATIYLDLVFVKFPKGRYSLESMALVILSVI